jgi:uncharacterized protein YcaQ
VPAPKREHGYFAMPLLTGGRLVGRVDPKREGTTLHAPRVSLRPRAVDAMAAALREAAQWVGCDAVAVGQVDPPQAAPALRATLPPGSGRGAPARSGGPTATASRPDPGGSVARTF